MIFRTARLRCFLGLVLTVTMLNSSALTFGLFTYEVVGGTSVTITDYPTYVTGEVTIPNTINGLPVINIGNKAFGSCGSLTKITIPSSVTRIEVQAFRLCNRLANITVDSQNSAYASLDGVLFDKSLATLIECPEARTGNYTVPSSVTSIGDYAFYDCDNLTSIAISARVTSIGDQAFGYCYSLTDITIPSSVTSIGSKAFYSCYRLTDITIPSSVTSIGDQAFGSCKGLTNMTVDSQNSAYASLDGVLFDKSLATLIKYPDARVGNYTIPSSVTSIGDYAFYDCDNLTSIMIPTSVASIGDQAFKFCASLIGAWLLGDAPSMGANVFNSASSAFTIHYLEGATGLTSPTWAGYPSEMIDEVTYPAARWLLQNNMALDTDLHQDLNGDGVDLLLAYALDLAPENAPSGLPAPILETDSLNMNFYASAPGVNYTVQTSADLKTWVTEGVVLSPIDSNGKRTATVNRTTANCFMRLIADY